MCCEDPDLEATLAPAPSYEILDGTAIRCLVCGRTSDHPRDLAERYCGFCHRWHDRP